MMETMITGQQLENVVYRQLQGTFAQEVGLYKGGTRPIRSEKTDVVVSFHEGATSVLQSGSVLINAFVPDVLGTDGLYYKDIPACERMEAQLLTLDRLLTDKTGILFENRDMLYATEDLENREHVISLKLNFKHVYY